MTNAIHYLVEKHGKPFEEIGSRAICSRTYFFKYDLQLTYHF